MYLGNNTGLVQTEFGGMFIDTRDTSIAPHLILSGAWALGETQVLQRFLNPNVHFVDVGANVGWFSLVAHRAGVRRITAFEPQYGLWQLLCRTMSINGCPTQLTTWRARYSEPRKSEDLLHAAVTPKNYHGDQQHRWFWSGVSDAVSEMWVSRLPDNFGGAHLVPQQGHMAFVPEMTEPGYSAETFKVSVTPLDDVVEPEPDVPYVIKIDVEGMEPKVVSGAQRLLSQCSCTVLYEWWDKTEKQKEALEFFQQNGYGLQHVGNGVLHNLELDQLANVPNADMLCFQRVRS